MVNVPCPGLLEVTDKMGLSELRGDTWPDRVRDDDSQSSLCLHFHPDTLIFMVKADTCVCALKNTSVPEMQPVPFRDDEMVLSPDVKLAVTVGLGLYYGCATHQHL